MKTKKLRKILSGLLLYLFSCSISWAGFTTTTNWDEPAVRKVLHTFAYGGFASDEQIWQWSKMPPEDAIQEMLTFSAVNTKLSPIQDYSAGHGYSLTSLQNFWSSTDVNNPVREDQRIQYDLLYTNPTTGEKVLADPFLKNTWVQAATTRGINPFLHRVGFYLTNYHMAISISKTRPGLMRNFYDQTIVALQQGYDLIDVLGFGAMSAAVAMAYGHQFNYYVNPINYFSGNDDFAREFHQLFFRIQGTTEDQDYHENTTIEHTAHLLTGMLLDYSNPWGSSFDFDWAAAPINFSDHDYVSGAGATVSVFNYSLHHHNDLEILHTPISGNTAQEKIIKLARVAGYHPESLDNIPVTIIDYFADDNLTEDKKATIRAAWREQEPKLLLEFLRSYAISTTFHRSDTFKYRSAFERNLLVHNFNTIDNQESFARFELPTAQMLKEGADVFQPAHDVFGGQTGLQAANNPNIFKEAFQRNVQHANVLARTSSDDFPPLPVAWQKDWNKLIPKNSNGQHDVRLVAKWLWQRFIADGEKNFLIQEQAHVYALLASGADFGYLIDQFVLPTGDPETSYSSEQLHQAPLIDAINYLAAQPIALDSSDPAERREANRRVGMAINFITVTPFMFALEGK